MKKLLILCALWCGVAHADVTDRAPTCLPNSNKLIQLVGTQAGLTWQCRPAAGSMQRYWDRFYVIVDALAISEGAGKVFDAAVKGDQMALTLGAALRNKNLSDPSFSATYIAIQAKARTQAPIASRVAPDGTPCACDLVKPDLTQYLWQCPTIKDLKGPFQACKPQ